MRDADVAMYRAKADGKGRHAVFDEAMHQQVMRRLDLEGDLRRAVEERALEVAYQPIVQAATGRIVGFEASCRWPTGRARRVPRARRGDRARHPARAADPRDARARSSREWRKLPRAPG